MPPAPERGEHRPAERLDGGAPTSSRSDRVKAVRRLAGRSARERSGAFAVEGPRAVREALRAHESGTARVRELYATAEALARNEDIARAAERSGVPARLVPAEVLVAMVDTVHPQGLLAVCDLVGVPLEQVLAARPRLVAVLARVRDPGNAGTVIRAADAAGADAVILTDASVDVHNPKCVRSTAGSLFHLPIVTGVSLAGAAEALRSAGLTVLAADGAGALDLDRLQEDGANGVLHGGVAWVFGNEAWGLPQADREVADAVVRVPIHGHAESLNLAIAAALCLYATARVQRG